MEPGALTCTHLCLVAEKRTFSWIDQVGKERKVLVNCILAVNNVNNVNYHTVNISEFSVTR